MRVALLLLLMLSALLVACGSPQAPLVVSELEITRPMPGTKMSAGFLVLTNNTDETIVVTSVTSPQFESVEMHETTVTDGISRMRELETLEVPGQGSVTLERGGKHLMLMRPNELQDSVSLQFLGDGAPLLSVDYSFPQGDHP